MTEILCITSGKGGVGKTTTTFAIAEAAVRQNSVLVFDLDPMRSISRQFKVPYEGGTVADLISGEKRLQDIVYETESEVLIIPGSKDLSFLSLGEDALYSLIEPAIGNVDYVLLDTQPSMGAIDSPMRVATKIVVPSIMDMVSLPIAAETVALAKRMGILDKVVGVLGTNVRRPLSVSTREIYGMLREGGVALEHVMWSTKLWPEALALGTLKTQPVLMTIAQEIFDEILEFKSPNEALSAFAALLGEPVS